jgi:hypothetical protein
MKFDEGNREQISRKGREGISKFKYEAGREEGEWTGAGV